MDRNNMVVSINELGSIIQNRPIPKIEANNIRHEKENNMVIK